MKKLNRVFSYIIVAILVTICSLASCAKADYGDNLVKNGGFELSQTNSLPDGWQIVPAYKGKGEAVSDETNKHEGRYSLKLTPNSKNTSEAFGIFQMLDVAGLKGKQVTIKGFVRTEGISGTAAILLDTGQENWVALPKDTGKEFVSFDKTLSLPNSISKAGLLLLVSGTKGSIWFDDVSVSIIQEAQTKESVKADITEEKNEYINKINSPGWQDSVYISPDGQELYFAYLPFVQKDFMDLYFKKISEKDVKERGPFRPGSHGKMNFETYLAVRKQDGTWSTPVNLNINSTYSLYSAKLSHDGKELYYAIRDFKGNYGADDIYVSRKLPDGSWTAPENLGPNINTKFREDTPCLTADGNTMYFARNEHETLGWEIMVSHRVDGQWIKATRLGEPINQAKPETTANYQPFITSDGNEFYFTRIQQLYLSRRQPDGSWGKPVSVFPNLPVSAHSSVTDDGKYLYILAAKDKESLKREHWTIWYSERKNDGSWGDPKPVD